MISGLARRDWKVTKKAVAGNALFFETLFAAEIEQVDNERSVSHFTTQTTDQFNGRFDSAAGCQQIVHHQNFVARFVFSATLEGDAIQDFAERLLEDPVEVSANPSTRERKKIHQWYYRADDLEHKTALLVHLLKQPEATRSIVFVTANPAVFSRRSKPMRVVIWNGARRLWLSAAILASSALPLRNWLIPLKNNHHRNKRDD